MPGFLSTTTPLSAFTVDKPASVTAEKLRQYAFRSIDTTTETESAGWTNSDDMTDTAWNLSPPEKGGFLCFSLRVDKRKAPAAVVNRFVTEALYAELEKCRAEGKERVSRKRKKELKELHTQKLLSQAVPVPTVTEAALDMTSGLLYVASTSSSAITALVDLMATSFKVECVPLRQVAGVLPEDVEQVLADVFSNGASVNGFTLEYAGQAQLHQGNEAQVTVKNEPDSVQSSLAAGLRIARLKVRMEGDDGNTWEFTINNDVTLTGLKTPHVDTAPDGDPDAVMLEKLFLIEQAVQVVLELVTVRYHDA